MSKIIIVKKEKEFEEKKINRIMQRRAEKLAFLQRFNKDANRR
ncbi:hypothetical protein ES703_82272 [subsurface metagenome]